jgi:hypothetical protein
VTEPHTYINTSLRDIAEAVYAATNPIDWKVEPGRLVSPVVDLGYWRGHLEIHTTFGGVLLPLVELVYEGLLRRVEHNGAFFAINPWGHASTLLRIFRRKFAAAEETRLRIMGAGLGIGEE